MGRKKRIGLWILISLLVCVLSGIYLLSTGRGEEESLQAEKMKQLTEQAGRFNESSIVLTNTTRNRAQNIAELVGARVRMTADGSYAVLYLPESVSVEDVYASEEYSAYLADMDLDYYVKAQETDANENELLAVRPEYDVNDPDYGRQTNLDFMNLRNTWNTARGQGISIAVIDSGIDTDHPDFAGKISEKSYNASEDKTVRDYGTEVIEDEQGHGTCVAGVISAQMNNAQGMTGIAPEAELVVIKCNCGSDGEFLRSSDLVFGIAYAIECGVDVINMSFGVEENVFEKYLSLAADSDIICVAAAGNDASSIPVYPAACENVIGVGAMDADSFELATYSNYGINSDLLAPGTVYTTELGGGYGRESGTSMASPAVAGAIALFLSGNPGSGVEQVSELLKASSVDLGVLGEDMEHGFGALDVHAFVCEEKGTITYEMLTDELKNRTQYFVKGHTIQYMPEPERDDLVLEGWYFDSECMDSCEYYTNVFSSDCTLYAGWIEEDEGTVYGYSTLEDGTVELQAYFGRRKYLTLPSEIEGKKVTSIGAGAFQNKRALRSVVLPASLKSIGERAFEGCEQLNSLELPDEVQQIGAYAFSGCTFLRRVSISQQSALQKIEDCAFSKCGLVELALPGGLNFLHEKAFYGSTALKKLTVSEENTSYQIRDGALYDSSGTTLLYYPSGKGGTYRVADGTTSIGAFAFAYSKCREVELPASLGEVHSFAFALSAVREMELPDGISVLGDSAFWHSALSKMGFGQNSSLTVIPARCFAGCEQLKSISLPACVTEISEEAFFASGLREIGFASDTVLSSLGAAAFAYTPLARIDIPDSVLSVSKDCFSSAEKLKAVSFSEHSLCAEISDRAFAQCSSLSVIGLPDSVTSIGSQTFYRSGIKSVQIGKNVSRMGNGVFSACPYLEEIVVDAENPVYSSDEGVLYQANGERLLVYPSARSGSFRMAATTKEVAAYAFAEAGGLTGIEMSDALEEIEEYAFCGCLGLSAVELPDSLITIGASAFENCEGMVSVRIPKSVLGIGRMAFGGNTSLQSVEIESGSGLSRLGAYTFANCGITQFTVPANVSSMGQGVFEGCQNLTSLIFETGSRLQYLAADVLKNATQLQSITFQENGELLSIEACALQGMEHLEHLELEQCRKLQKIGNYAFRDCTDLKEIRLPDSVMEIGRYAFAGCSSLSKVKIPEKTDYIGRYAFYQTQEMNVYFQAAVLPQRLEENWDAGILGYYVGTGAPIRSGDWTYALTKEEQACVIAYHGSAEEIALDQIDGHTVISIGAGAFEGNTSLKSIQLPDTLSGIYAAAFKGTSGLEKITIPAAVTVIDRGAFMGSGITSVSFAGGSQLKRIGSYAFAETQGMKADLTLPAGLKQTDSYAFYKSALSGIRFEQGSELEEIGRFAFAQSELKTVTLPDSLKKIDYYAFSETGHLQSAVLGNPQSLMLMGHAFYKSALQKVQLPKGVGYIGEACFTACDSLTEISVDVENTAYTSVDGVLFDKAMSRLITCPAGKTGSYAVMQTVATFAPSAFEGCRLSDITLPEDSLLITIGAKTFMGCPKLRQITIPSGVQGIGSYAFAYCEMLEQVNIGDQSRMNGIYRGAFYNCAQLSQIGIPASVQEIGEYAFYGCVQLKQAGIPAGSQMKGIFDYAFANTGVEQFTMPEELEEIGAYAFWNTRLKEVTLKEGLKRIGSYAFADCGLEDMERFVFPETLNYVGKGVLRGMDHVVELTLPFVGENVDAKKGSLRELFEIAEVTQWSGDEFPYYLPDLKKVTILRGESIPEGAFQRFGLEEVNLPDSVTVIGAYAFEGCGRLSSISLPDSLELVGDYAFSSAEQLSELTLPDGLAEIGQGAFQYTGITAIVLPDSVRVIGREAFAYTKLIQIEIGKSMEEIGAGAFACATLSSIRVDAENPCFASQDGILYSKDDTKLILVPALAEGEIRIPSGLEEIGDMAFYNCSAITGVAIPDTVTVIGMRAFSRCTALKSVVVPDSVRQIGASCFEWDSALEEATVQCGRLADCMFQGCENLRVVTLSDGIEELPAACFSGCRNLTQLSLPDALCSIGISTFSGCSGITELYIPQKVRSIEDGAFAGCSSMEAFQVADGNAYYSVKDGILYDKAVTTMVAVPTGLKGGIKIPEGIQEIGDSAFSGMKELTTVDIPNSVYKIGNFCFLGCEKLAEIRIGNGVKQIGVIAFMDTAYSREETNWEDGALYCGTNLLAVDRETEVLRVREGTRLICDQAASDHNALREVYLADSTAYVGEDAFTRCGSLKRLHMGSSLLSIGDSAFFGTQLEALILPDTVEEVGELNTAGLRYLSLGTRENAVKGMLGGLGGDVKVAAIPYCGNRSLKEMLSNTREQSLGDTKIEKLILTTEFHMDPAFLSGLDEATVIYCHVEPDFWPVGWEQGHQVHYRDEWHTVSFYVDGCLFSMDAASIGGAVRIPAEQEIEDYLPAGSWFTGWDINGDGAVDSVPTTLLADTKAVAVLEVPDTGEDETATTEEAGQTETPTTEEAGQTETPTTEEAGQTETATTEETEQTETATTEETGQTETEITEEAGQAETPETEEAGQAETPETEEAGQTETTATEGKGHMQTPTTETRGQAEMPATQNTSQTAVTAADHGSVTTAEPAGVQKKKDHASTVNLKNGKTYKLSRKVKIKDADGLKQVKLNGKKIAVKKGKKSLTLKLSKYKTYLKNRKKWNQLVIVDVDGHKKNVKFKVKK